MKLSLGLTSGWCMPLIQGHDIGKHYVVFVVNKFNVVYLITWWNFLLTLIVVYLCLNCWTLLQWWSVSGWFTFCRYSYISAVEFLFDKQKYVHVLCLPVSLFISPSFFRGVSSKSVTCSWIVAEFNGLWRNNGLVWTWVRYRTQTGSDICQLNSVVIVLLWWLEVPGITSAASWLRVRWCGCYVHSGLVCWRCCRCICVSCCGFCCLTSIVTWRRFRMVWSCCFVTGNTLVVVSMSTASSVTNHYSLMVSYLGICCVTTLSLIRLRWTLAMSEIACDYLMILVDSRINFQVLNVGN